MAEKLSSNVDSLHPDYVAARDRWKKCRDVMAGAEAVRHAGTAYLPQLSGQSEGEYDAYRKRAHFFNASRRTREGLAGLIGRIAPRVDVEQSVKDDILRDVTLTQVPFPAFAQSIIEEHVLETGRCGVLVDHPPRPEDGAPITVAGARSLGLRPFATIYGTEQVIGWQTRVIRGRATLSQVRIFQHVEEPDGEFGIRCVEEILVLDLDERNLYRQRRFRKGDRGDWLPVGPPIYPQIAGAPMSEIPFQFFGARDLTPRISTPPLEDLVEANLSHWRTEADYAHGCHFTGLPTPVVTGVSLEPGSRLCIGSTEAWVFPDPNATASYLHFGGEGMKALVERLDRIEQHMAVLGARMLQADKRGVEAAETAQIYRQGEHSALATIAVNVGLGLSNVVRWLRDWSVGVSGKNPDVILNTDFFPAAMSGQDLAAVIAAWQQGALAFSDLVRLLKRGEILAEDRTEEEIRAERDAEAPTLTGDAMELDDEDEDQDGAPPARKAAA